MKKIIMKSLSEVQMNSVTGGQGNSLGGIDVLAQLNASINLKPLLKW